MSKEAISQMMQSASENPTLQHQLEQAGGLAEVVKIGAEKGYQFTEEEVQAFLSERGVNFEDSTEGELSEETLETVAGGFIVGWALRFRDW
ncbi:Nif11-like leader peptide family natural product precursor [Brasilonema sp. UFV-L1]|uniref:Nif11-like leader peptide family natural product precursor n=1 Tax=Brasilonema sp. UFV-L1 TaxID=2234130 RepID=UPI00145E2F65|nr:Nif11-like leader peptide family natural product precursor [Brasilonema sp. UFV-L1]NMG07825.1 Nif11-like leader peptide family natural product precursor [Brasilonema sp. UFV-L1]